jgi:hypothetical protein
MRSAAGEIDDIEHRLALIEQEPPRPLGGRELQRQRADAVLRARAGLLESEGREPDGRLEGARAQDPDPREDPQLRCAGVE